MPDLTIGSLFTGVGGIDLAVVKLLRRMYGWDVMDTTDDGKFWRGEINKTLAKLDAEKGPVKP